MRWGVPAEAAGAARAGRRGCYARRSGPRCRAWGMYMDMGQVSGQSFRAGPHHWCSSDHMPPCPLACSAICRMVPAWASRAIVLARIAACCVRRPVVLSAGCSKSGPNCRGPSRSMGRKESRRLHHGPCRAFQASLSPGISSFMRSQVFWMWACVAFSAASPSRAMMASMMRTCSCAALSHLCGPLCPS